MFAASGQVRVTVSCNDDAEKRAARLLAFAEPPLLRFVLDAALFAFQLRGEQFALFALPRKRRACDTSPYWPLAESAHARQSERVLTALAYTQT